ncbi:hypothetical protein Rhe02_05800 [Rhizocola hellebori]|uniref:Orc1-like AAA ATPase domain-containing protein n=1 Tax=Rhizocola hellebori TaxID=1392758 RepID=A0A8J3Q352_9ACTN|nr:NB-ARC domain-containing protein [Rhizocola hellebori]GIH02513.1 hypothetical protein Rhe02_05800 [Rhizocola hellebori]
MDFRLRRILANLLRAAALVAIIVATFMVVNHRAGWWILIAAGLNALILLAIEFWQARKSDWSGWPSSRHRLLVPQELPPQIGKVVGRQTDLDNLEAALHQRSHGGPLVIQITGPAGIGKTALALAAADRLAGRFPDGQLYEMLEGRSAREILGDMVGALKGPREAIDANEATAWRELTRGRRFLAILDDAADSQTVNQLLPARGSSAIIVTCHQFLTDVRTDARIDLRPLEPSEALDLLDSMLDDPRLKDEPAQAQRIVDIAAGIPLAVCLTGAALAVRPQWSLDLVLQRVDRLAPLPGGTLDVCYALLTSPERTALRQLALLTTAEFSPWHLQAMQGMTESEAWQIADRLAHAGLVERRTKDVAGVPTFRMLEHVRSYALRRLGIEVPLAEQDRAKALLTAAQEARASKDPAALLRANVYTRLEKGQLLDALNGARDVLALVRAQRSSNARRDEGLAFAALAEIHAELGSIEESWDLAMSALRLDEREVTPRALRCLGTLQFMMSPNGDAQETLRRALAAANKAADRPERVRILRRLAVVQAHLGRFKAADASIQEAMEYCHERQAAGHRQLVGVMWAEAVVRTLQGATTEAAGLLHFAHVLAGQGDLRLWRGWIDHQRAYVCQLSGDYLDSRRFALQGTDTFTDLGHRYGAAHCRLLGGMTLLKMGRARDSLALLEEALATFVTCGDMSANARAAIALAEAQQQLGNRGQAKRHLVLAVSSLESTGDWEEGNKARQILRGLKRWGNGSWTGDPALAVRSMSPAQ